MGATASNTASAHPPRPHLRPVLLLAVDRPQRHRRQDYLAHPRLALRHPRLAHLHDGHRRHPDRRAPLHHARRLVPRLGLGRRRVQHRRLPRHARRLHARRRSLPAYQKPFVPRYLVTYGRPQHPHARLWLDRRHRPYLDPAGPPRPRRRALPRRPLRPALPRLQSPASRAFFPPPRRRSPPAAGNPSGSSPSSASSTS